MVGMPRRLLFGYLALAIFMTGDGFELTFLSRFLVENGFTPTQAGLVFTVYGLVVAISAWTTGVLAEVVGAKRLMVLGVSSECSCTPGSSLWTCKACSATSTFAARVEPLTCCKRGS